MAVEVINLTQNDAVLHVPAKPRRASASATLRFHARNPTRPFRTMRQIIKLGRFKSLLRYIREPRRFEPPGGQRLISRRARRASLWVGVYDAKGTMPRGDGRYDVDATRLFTGRGPLKKVFESFRRAMRAHLGSLPLRRVVVQVSFPGSPDQPAHINHDEDGENYFTLLVPLDEPTTREMGFTRFTDDGDTPGPSPSFGEGLLFRGDIMHFGTGNRSRRTRHFLYCVFAGNSKVEN